MTTTMPAIEEGTVLQVTGTITNPRTDGHGHKIDLKGTPWVSRPEYAVTAFEVEAGATFAWLEARVGQQLTLTVKAQGYRKGKDGSDKARDRYWLVVPPQTAEQVITSAESAAAAGPAARAAAPAPTPAAETAPEQPARGRTLDESKLVPTIGRPSLNPNADKYSAQAELYGEWHRNRRTAMLTARELHGTDGGADELAVDTAVLDSADRLFVWLQGFVADDQKGE